METHHLFFENNLEKVEKQYSYIYLTLAITHLGFHMIQKPFVFSQY